MLHEIEYHRSRRRSNFDPFAWQKYHKLLHACFFSLLLIAVSKDVDVTVLANRRRRTRYLSRSIVCVGNRLAQVRRHIH